MPKRKHDSEEEESAVESNAASSEDEKPKKSAKKAKTTKSKASTSETKKKASSSVSEKEIEGVKYTVEGDEKWIAVGVRGTRRITIREFKGKTYVDIREFYVDKQTSELKAGKKGISLSVGEWHDLIRVKDAVTALAGGAEEV